MKILVADPGTAHQLRIQRELQSIADVQILMAAEPEQVLDLVQAEHPELITLTFRFEAPADLQLVHAIQALKLPVQPSLILLVEGNAQALQQQVFATGINELFPLGFERGQLRRYIGRFFAQEDVLKRQSLLLLARPSPLQTAVQRTLAKAGVELEIAEQLPQAIACLQEADGAEMLLLDEQSVPQISQACTQIRREVLRYPLPMVVLTQPNSPTPPAEILRAGANDLLLVPFQREELLARVCNHAQLVQYHRRLDSELQQRRLREKQVSDELEQAREAQQSLLPQTIPQIPGVEIAYRYEPVEQVGGDLYDAFPLPGHCFGLMVADVAGHGVPAALISFMVATAFSQSALLNLSCAQTLLRTNELLHGRIAEDKFATVFYAIYNPVTHQLDYASAGHPHALILRQGQEVQLLRAKGPFLGPFPNEQMDLEQRRCQLEIGDTLLLYTDAVVEASNAQGQRLGTERLGQMLRDYHALPIHQLLEKVYETLIAYTAHRRDDCTLLGLRVLE